MADAAIVLHQEIRDSREENWGMGRHMKAGKTKLSWLVRGHQDDCHFVLSDLVKHL